MNIQGIIFDLDGTLIDSIPDITTSANQLLQNHGFVTHEASDYTRWIGNGARKLLERAIPEGIDGQTMDRMLEEYLDLYSENCTRGTMVYEGIAGLLEFLARQKIPFSILTNKPHEVTQKVVKHYFPDIDFRFILGQRNGFPRKPDPSVALKIASGLKCVPSNMLFIGDSDTDMRTGKSAGMMPVGVTWGYGSVDSLLQAGCEQTVNSANELIQWIDKTNTK